MPTEYRIASKHIQVCHRVYPQSVAVSAEHDTWFDIQIHQRRDEPCLLRLPLGVISPNPENISLTFHADAHVPVMLLRHVIADWW